MSDQAVVFITGTSRGIGRHLAQHYSAQDFLVAGCSRHAVDDWSHPRYTHLEVDVGVEADVMRAFTEIRSRFGRLDVLINNAAVNPTLSLAVLTPYALARQALTVNVLGTFLMAREAAKLMMRRRFGRIITLGSMAVRHEVAGESVYTASKAAVTALTRVLAKELYPFGITCNVVAPAAVETDLMAAVKPEALREVLKRNAIPNTGKVEDVSGIIDWLIRPESQAVTGQVVYLGGA